MDVRVENVKWEKLEFQECEEYNLGTPDWFDKKTVKNGRLDSGTNDLMGTVASKDLTALPANGLLITGTTEKSLRQTTSIFQRLRETVTENAIVDLLKKEIE